MSFSESCASRETDWIKAMEVSISISSLVEKAVNLAPNNQQRKRRRGRSAKIRGMEASVSISSLVEKAVNSGLTSPEPKRRRGRTAKVIEDLVKISARNPEDDSDFDDSYLSDAVWDKMYKYEEQDFDQHIFNVFRQDRIDTQERKVNVTTAICIRDCPEKAEEIAMWTKQAKPMLSKAPKRRREVNNEKAKRDLELDMILAEAVAEMEQYPSSNDEESLFEMWL